MERLIKWYCNQFNGDWEFGSGGIVLQTSSNPGWVLSVDLRGTDLEDKNYNEFKMNFDSDTAWVYCYIEDGFFKATCGIGMLEIVINEFAEFLDC